MEHLLVHPQMWFVLVLPSNTGIDLHLWIFSSKQVFKLKYNQTCIFLICTELDFLLCCSLLEYHQPTWSSVMLFLIGITKTIFIIYSIRHFHFKNSNLILFFNPSIKQFRIICFCNIFSFIKKL